ncbi:MAG: energy transducer TonB [Thiohalomonadales bacterium]
MVKLLRDFVYPCSFVFLLAACTAGPVKERKDLCLDQPDAQRLECYWSDIRALIRAEIESDYRAYIRELRDSDKLAEPPVFGGVSLEVFLSSTGYVERINYLDSSRNTLFDTMVERAVRNASPFYLPADATLKNALRRFRFSIRL